RRGVGFENALKTIVRGGPVPSEMLAKAPGQKLFDKLVDSDVLGAAIALAQEKADVRPLPLVRNLKAEHPNSQAYFQFARNMVGGMSKNFPAPLKCVDAVEAAVTKKFDDGVGIIRKNYDAQVKKGKLKQDKLDQRMALMSTTLNYADLKDADLVIEAVFEDIGVKEQVFKTLDEVMKPGSILASNTSTLDLNKIASFTKRPQVVIGMHF